MLTFAFILLPETSTQVKSAWIFSAALSYVFYYCSAPLCRSVMLYSLCHSQITWLSMGRIIFKIGSVDQEITPYNVTNSETRKLYLFIILV